MDAGVQYAVSRRLKNTSAEAFVEVFRCLGGDGFLWILWGWGWGCLCLWWILWVLVWTRKGVEGYCVERAGRDFLSGVCLDWTGLDWGDGGEKGDG